MITKRRVKERQLRRIKRCQHKYESSGLVRLVVHRSSKHIYGQLVNDYAGVCITAASSLSPGVREKTKGLTKTRVALLVGEALAARAKEKNIEKIVFDRHGYKYQGRIKALAEGARKGGLKF